MHEVKSFSTIISEVKVEARNYRKRAKLLAGASLILVAATVTCAEITDGPTSDSFEICAGLELLAGASLTLKAGRQASELKDSAQSISELSELVQSKADHTTNLPSL